MDGTGNGTGEGDSDSWGNDDGFNANDIGKSWRTWSPNGWRLQKFMECQYR